MANGANRKEIYLYGLDRAGIGEKEVSRDEGRQEIPDPELLIEGNKTIIANFRSIASAIRRRPEHLIKFLTGELGAPGNYEGGRAIIYTSVKKELFREKFDRFLREYVVCRECGKLDTHIEKDGRMYVVKCEACGARRWVKPLS
jgi:translation initiation factor 2 subunit 2